MAICDNMRNIHNRFEIPDFEYPFEEDVEADWTPEVRKMLRNATDLPFWLQVSQISDKSNQTMVISMGTKSLQGIRFIKRNGLLLLPIVFGIMCQTFLMPDVHAELILINTSLH